MKSFLLFIALLLVSTAKCNGQIKETVQLATLSPTLFVIHNSEMKTYHKHHYLISTIGYMGSYMVFESKWKAALFTLAMGAGKELVYDSLLKQGEPLWSDMKWNALGVGQGVIFTVSLEF